MAMVFLDLVLDTGELIRIECPDKYHDELHDSLDNSRKRGDWWSTALFDGCSATFMGMSLDRIAMSRVIGML